MKLYLAGPLFTQAERRWLRELSGALASRGHDVFLPQDDASTPLLRSPPDFHGAFESCRDAIDHCAAVVAVLEQIFSKGPSEATAIMLAVHKSGLGVAGVYTLEVAETKVVQVHNAAEERGYPLCSGVEKE